MEHIEIANIQRMKLHFGFGRRPVVMLRRGAHASKQLFYVVLCACALITAARCETNELRETSADHARLEEPSNRTTNEVIIASKSLSEPHTEEASWGSAYIPNDSWIYPAMLRLYSLGYVDTIFLSMRPWARVSVIHALLASHDNIVQGSDEAKEILAGLERELSIEMQPEGGSRGTIYGFQSLYTRILGIAGTPLRDSYHLGQTIVNDYGRPYQEGFNNVTGFSTLNETGRFSLYVRGEYQHSPAAQGYSLQLAENLSTEDQIPYAGPNTSQVTIPAGPIAAENTFQLQEAVLSVHLLGHEISGGKSDAWFGPAVGGSLAWSNNAENIYSFRINRVEPLNVYLISKLLGPMRYDFFVGSLKGHTSPNSPWVHAEMFAFRPTNNFEFGFERTIIWGGVDHAPVTMHTFLHGFLISTIRPDRKRFRETTREHVSATSTSRGDYLMCADISRCMWIPFRMTM